MKKNSFLFALLLLIGFTFTSCRETVEERREVEIRTDDVGDDLEDAADDVGDEIENAADEVEDEI